MQLTVNVTQQHIDNGKRRDCDVCPIALAVKDALPKSESGIVLVGVDVIWIERPGCFTAKRRGSLPDEAQIFIAQFDRAYHVAPFTFQVELVEVN